MNQEQTAAAFSKSPRVVCVAGPGSGKTTTLVQAVAAKARKDGPQSVVCITFTNAAADEMRSRLVALPPEQGGGFGAGRLGYIGTLHSFLLKLLRAHGHRIGLPAKVAVVDDDVVDGLVEQVMDDMGVRCPAKRVLEKMALPNLITAEPGMAYAKDDLVVIEVHRRLLRDGLLTLDALLIHGHRLVWNLRDARDFVWGYQHLFVDEFQDSNPMDMAIYEAMPFETRFVVGDPDQAVYGFRGGSVDNLLQIASGQVEGLWEIHKLETNYRCRDKICAAAQRLVEHNSRRVQKFTVANEPGGCVAVACHAIPAEEEHWLTASVFKCVAQSIARLHLPEDFNQTAVLCRTNHLARELATALRSAGIPVALEERPVDPPDWTAAKLLVAALEAPGSDTVWTQLVKLLAGPVEAKRVAVNAATAMTSVMHQAKVALGWRLYNDESGRLPMEELLSRESQNRIMEARRELDLNGSWTLGDLSAYLCSGERSRPKHQPGVFVGTVHAAKGREWDHVFVCGLEEGSFPQAKKDTDVEEERRLMFVAMTRARFHLELSYCQQRPQRRGPNLPPGPMERKQPSRFIKEAGL